MALNFLIQGGLMAGKALLGAAGKAAMFGGKAALKSGLGAEAAMGGLMGMAYGDPLGGAISGAIGGGLGNVIGGGLAKVNAPRALQSAGTMAGYMGGNIISEPIIQGLRPRDEAMQTSAMREMMSNPGANEYMRSIYGQ
jgi:hypothetical protein